MINRYLDFTDYTNQVDEQKLIQDLVDEAIQAFGMDVKYIPKTLVDLDTIFGESPLMTFDDFITVEMYFNTPSGMGGDVQLSKFLGIANAFTTNFLVSSKRFDWLYKTKYSPTPLIQLVRPNEGDLIYMPMTRDFWEIKVVKFLNPMFQFGKVMMWQLDVEKFVYSSERIHTGDTELDKLQTAFSHDSSIPVSDLMADNTKIQTEAGSKIDSIEYDPFTEGNL